MKPAEREFVSVVIPVYNLERYLPEAVESVLAQTHTDFEIILSMTVRRTVAGR